jgi:Protein of unknown function (DUF3429)
MFEHEIQRWAWRLAGAGLLPFVWFAGEILFGAAFWNVHPVHAYLSYGATILAFLGGMYWMQGITMCGASRLSVMLMALSVLPSLTAWGALLVHGRVGLLIFLGGCVGLLGMEWHFYRHELIPAWFWNLRWRISAVVIGLTIIAFGRLAL